jgi:phospholipid transport system substrate-binding protein
MGYRPDESDIMNRRYLARFFSAAVAACLLTMAPLSYAADEAPDQLVKRLSSDVLNTIKSDKALQAGDLPKLVALVDTKIMPNVNFQRMTASATGPAWRKATPDQQKALQDEFKILLVRTYAGALSQVSDQDVVMKPLRASPDDKELVVRTEIKGKTDPVQLDYRLEKTPGVGAGWKIYDLNVMGVWLVETYKGQFSQEINARGIDGLVASLGARNKANAKKN